MYVNRTWERPFGNDEPHIGGYWDYELISEPEEVENLFLDDWFDQVFVTSSVVAIDDYSEDDIELEAQHYFSKDFRYLLQDCLEHFEYEELTRVRFDSIVVACELQVKRKSIIDKLKRKKL